MSVLTPEQELNARVESMKNTQANPMYYTRTPTSPIREVKPGQQPLDALIQQDKLLGPQEISTEVNESLRQYREHVERMPMHTFTIHVATEEVKKQVLLQLRPEEQRPWRMIAIH